MEGKPRPRRFSGVERRVVLKRKGKWRFSRREGSRAYGQETKPVLMYGTSHVTTLLDEPRALNPTTAAATDIPRSRRLYNPHVYPHHTKSPTYQPGDRHHSPNRWPVSRSFSRSRSKGHPWLVPARPWLVLRRARKYCRRMSQ